MGGLEKFDDRTWDRFFDFITPDVEQLSIADVDADLQRARIDVSKAFTDVKAALEARIAREALERARTIRPAIAQKLSSLLAIPFEQGRAALQGLIKARFSGEQQAVCFRKLEEAATTQDLASLLEDLQALEQLDLDLEDEDGKR